MVDSGADPAALEFSTYQEMFVAAVGNIERSLEIAASFNGFEYQVYPGGQVLDGTLFAQLANSYLARLAIGLARTDAEAQGLDYGQILSYADNAITEDFSPTSTENVFFNNLQDWSQFQLGDGAGYLPSDIKIQHLFDSSYPTEYPLDENIVLGEVETDDPRLTLYYEYVGENFGFLRASRGRQLFSSYRTLKFFNDNDQNQTGLPTNIFAAAEIDYIKAECNYRMGRLRCGGGCVGRIPENVGWQPSYDTGRS